MTIDRICYCGTAFTKHVAFDDLYGLPLHRPIDEQSVPACPECGPHDLMHFTDCPRWDEAAAWALEALKNGDPELEWQPGLVDHDPTCVQNCPALGVDEGPPCPDPHPCRACANEGAA